MFNYLDQYVFNDFPLGNMKFADRRDFDRDKEYFLSQG